MLRKISYLSLVVSLMSCLPTNSVPVPTASPSATPKPSVANPLPSPAAVTPSVAPSAVASAVPTVAPTVSATPALSNLVEPISFSPKLSAKAGEIMQQFGITEVTGDLETDDFRVVLSQDVMAGNPDSISYFYIRNRQKTVDGVAQTVQSRAKLACGLGIGDTPEEVKQAFGFSERGSHGQYALTFRYDEAGLVSEIEIAPANAEFQPI